MRFGIKLLVILICVALLPMVGVSAVILNTWHNELSEKTEDNLIELVKLKADYYNREFSEMRNVMESASFYISSNWGKGTYYNTSYIWFTSNLTDNWKDDLKNFEYVKQAFDSMLIGKNKIKINLVFFGLENGICFLSDSALVKYLNENIPQFDHRERIWYTLAKEKNATVWSPMYVDVNTGELVTTLSKPIFINGKFVGVMGFDLLLTTIKNDILDISYENTGIPLLVERNGDIIVHPEYTAEGKSWNESFREENIANVSSFSSLEEKIFNASTGFEIVSFDEKRHYAVFAPINEINGSLLFLLPEKVVMQNINNMINRTAFFLLLTFLIISLIILLFVSSVTKPIEELRAGAMEVAKGNLEYRLDIKSNDEFGDLAREFNRMVERLKKAQDEIRESHERYKSIFDGSADVIYITTEDGKIIDINKAGEKLFGYTREELLRMNPIDFYVDKEDRERFKKEIEKKGFVKDYEVRLKRKDGKVLECILSTTMLEKNGKKYYQGIIRDVTQLKEAKRQLDMYNSLLRHDISNRNQITLGCLELLMEEEMEEEKKELVRKAYDHLSQAHQLLQKLSIVNKVGEIKLKERDLKKVLRNGIERYDYFAKEKGIKIIADLREGCVIADELLENVFSNIIENAIVHSGCKKIEIKNREEGDEMVITISDDGNGIPDELAERIFEWGVKGEKSKGSGFGLHLVKRIVEGYGGKILLKEHKNGLTFEIRLKKC